MDMSAPLQGQFPIVHLSTEKNNFINYALVDAFTDAPFKGNPAGICILPAWREADWLQQVASQLNVNMMAFLVKRPDNSGSNDAIMGGLPDREENRTLSTHAYDIRWFTPVAEVSLCGHATLAASYLLFGSGILDGGAIQFHTKIGQVLFARKVEKESKVGFFVELEYPILLTSVCDFSLASLSNTLQDLKVISCHITSANDLLVELPSGEEVQAMMPCFDEIKSCDFRGLIVTGKALDQNQDYDFVSRFFAPKIGLDEDPVCGQAHCALAAFWGKKLNKSSLVAYQASKRGGTIQLRVDFTAGRVYLQGEATLVMSGILLI